MYLAAQPLPLGTIGGNDLGPFGNIGSSGNSAAGMTGITNMVSAIIGALTAVAAIWFLFMLLFSGYEWMSSGGDPKKLANARDHITHAFIGMVIIAGSWSLVAIVGQFLGFNTLDPSIIIQYFPHQ